MAKGKGGLSPARTSFFVVRKVRDKALAKQKKEYGTSIQKLRLSTTLMGCPL